jgi:putative ABC transport system permease protein
MAFHDFRYALRSLRKSPGFVAVAVLSLGLGLGLTTTMFALLDAVTHPYVPYREPERLFRVQGWFPTKRLSVPSFDVYRAVRDRTRSFESVAPISYEQVALDGAESADLSAARVPSRYFALLGVTPRVGRVLQDGDADRGLVVVSYEVWRQRLAGRRSLGGASLTLGGNVYGVVGVMPRGMDGGVWFPLSSEAERVGAGLRWTSIVARLGAGITLDAAKADLDALARQLTVLHHAQDAPFAFQLYPLRDDPMRLGDIHYAMLGAGLSVLLIACANLANLMLARGLSKRREIALRLAIGASRGAVVRQMFAECAAITVAGALVGVAFSLWGADILESRVPQDMWWVGVVRPQLSWRVFALTALAAAASAILFGLIPAIRVAWAVSLDEPLKDGAGTTGRTRQRYSALVMTEVALALILLMGGGLLIKVVRHLASYEFNFAARHLLQGFAFAPEGRDPAPQVRMRFQQELLAAARGVPGVVDAAAQTDGKAPGGAVTAELTGDSTRVLSMAFFPVVTPAYLRTMGLPVLEGRDFADGDLAGDGVVILNAAGAARLYPRQRPVGRMLKLGGPSSTAAWLPIVGVARSAIEGRPGQLKSVEPRVYVVRAPDPGRGVRLLIRTGSDEPRIAVAVARRLRSATSARAAWVVPYLTWYESELRSRNFLAQLFVTMGSFALVLAAVGIYGVLAYAVNRRLREFAVRMALGAQRSDMVKLVLHDGLVMTLAGTGLGAFIALWAANLLEGFLEDVRPTDVRTLVSVEAVLIAVATAACLAPALRAMRADPIEILRAT